MDNPLYLFAILTPWLVVLCYYDCRYRCLPNQLTLSVLLIALVWRFGSGGLPSFCDGLTGGLFSGLFLLLPFYLRSAGGGDVKMLTAVGCVLGFSRVALLLLITSVSGLILAIVMLIFGLATGQRLKHYLRCLFDWRYDRKAGRESLPPKSDERARIPFGVAIAVGVWGTLFVEIIQRNGVSG